MQQPPAPQTRHTVKADYTCPTAKGPATALRVKKQNSYTRTVLTGNKICQAVNGAGDGTVDTTSNTYTKQKCA